MPISPTSASNAKIRAYSGLIHYDAKNDDARLAAGDQGRAGQRKAERHRRHARFERSHLVCATSAAAARGAADKRATPPAAATQPARRRRRRRLAAPAGYAKPHQPQNAAANDGAALTPGGSYEFHTDQWAAALRQAHRRHDRRAQEQRRAGDLGRAAGDPRRQIDQRHELSRRALSRRAPRRPASPMSISGTALSTSRADSRCRARISRARSGGCAPPTASISPKPAR